MAKPEETEVPKEDSAEVIAAKLPRPADKRLKTVNEKLVRELIKNGIPLAKAVFRHAATAFEGTPETAFYSQESSKDRIKSRVANIWYTPAGIVIEQRGFYKLMPLAACIDTIVL